jgi:uncharacterized protein YoxC
MDEFLRMNVFFVIATIGFVVLAIMVAVILFYVIKLLRTISRVADTVEEEAVALKGDLDEARASIKRQGSSLVSNLLTLFGFAGKTGKRILKKRRSS